MAGVQPYSSARSDICNHARINGKPEAERRTERRLGTGEEQPDTAYEYNETAGEIMAGTDVANAFDGIKDLLKTASVEGIDAARKEAADVYIRAAKQSAPNRSGRLAKSIKLIEGKSNGALTTTVAGSDRRYYVGPEKRTGYHGYFVDKGHRSNIRAFNGKVYSNRIPRKGKSARPQSGESEPNITVAARPWFESAIKGVEQEAQGAAERAFYQVLSRKDR